MPWLVNPDGLEIQGSDSLDPCFTNTRARSQRRESVAFALALAAILAAFFSQSLFLGKVLSPADVLYAQRSFPGKGENYEPANRLLIDPVLQFEPWLEFSRAEIRSGRLPLWNPYAGCGAPHLANAQSGIFDPVHLIAYLGTLPDAFAWMAAFRLWIAGLGMYWLAREWNLGFAGRWFAGLTFPFCGFLIVWLQYPVTPAAIWLPWLLWATQRLLNRPGIRQVAYVAAFTALPLLAGHVQTAAHLLLAAGLLTLFELFNRNGRTLKERLIPLTRWGAGITLGVGLAAVQLLPLASYLSKSPVWQDRLAERDRDGGAQPPRLLDSFCTAFPYLYGSQRQGQPNVAKFLGVHNLNESAGGYAGIPAWLVLAPLSMACLRVNRRVPFLLTLLALGFCLAFAIPPLPRLLGPLPILNVIDHRRTTLWLAFATIMLAAIGLDRLSTIRPARPAIVCSGLLALLMFAAALGLTFGRDRIWQGLEPRLAARMAAAVPAEQARYQRHIQNALEFYPRYIAGISVELFALASLLSAYRRGRIGGTWAAAMLTGLTLFDLLAFSYGLNPEISRSDSRPESAVIEKLRTVCPFPARVLAIDTEFPPNTLMRYGLCDLRNYDSIELSTMVNYCEPLFAGDTGQSRTSRREIGWAAILDQQDRLVAAGVRAIVSRSLPPEALRQNSESVSGLWITRLDGPEPGYSHLSAGEIRIDDTGDPRHPKTLAVSFDPGWKVTSKDPDIPVETSNTTFLGLRIPPGVQTVHLRYEPIEVQIGIWISGGLLLAWLSLFVCVRNQE